VLEDPRTQKRWLLVIVALGIIVRFIAMPFLPFDMSGGAFEFGHIAENLVAGNGFAFDFYGHFPNGPTAFMAPVYPFILAGYMYLFGSNLIGMAFIQIFVTGVAIWGFGLFAARLSGPVVGVITAAIFAFYPEMIFMPLKYVSEPWLLLLTAFFLLTGMEYFRTGKNRYIFLAGVLAGLAALTKESSLFYPAGLMLWVLLRKGWSYKLVKDTFLIFLVMFVVIAPWTVRNYVVFGEFIPIRTNFWVNFWRGNHPGATGSARGYDKDLIDFSMDPDYAERIDKQLVGNEIDRERVYRDFALEFVRENPGKYVELCLRRLLFYWTIDPTHPLTGNPLYWVPWILLVITASIGVYAVRDRWQDYSFWYLLIIVMTAVYSLMLVLPRYRIPLIPGLIMLASEGIYWLVFRKRSALNV